jgi:hypothetical protein
MFTHPDLMWAQLKQRQHDLIAEADAYRLLAAARRSRRTRAAFALALSPPGRPGQRRCSR